MLLWGRCTGSLPGPVGHGPSAHGGSSSIPAAPVPSETPFHVISIFCGDLHLRFCTVASRAGDKWDSPHVDFLGHPWEGCKGPTESPVSPGVVSVTAAILPLPLA